ncbi:aquaporin-like protein [Dentipellis sp. KUC8613]|nr:aquaporin-like protein [Dentipellis sp. KUC8613]
MTDSLADDCFAAFLEFVGTTVFLMLAFGGVQAAVAAGSADDAGGAMQLLLFVALSFGFSLLVSAWLFFRVTGGLFNPEVSIALMLVGVIQPARCLLYCIAQLAGGVAAAALVLALTPGPVSYDTFLQQGTNEAQGVFIEMFVTSTLVLSVLMLAAEKHQATPLAPVGIGLTLFACELFAVRYTGGSLNTARSFGPAAVTGFPHSDHWVYWVGPALGALLGVFFYSILKHYRYWKLNPDQEATDPRMSPADPVERVVKSGSGSGMGNSSPV